MATAKGIDGKVVTVYEDFIIHDRKIKRWAKKDIAFDQLRNDIRLAYGNNNLALGLHHYKRTLKRTLRMWKRIGKKYPHLQNRPAPKIVRDYWKMEMKLRWDDGSSTTE